MWLFPKKTPKSKPDPLTIDYLWSCKNELTWKQALNHYYELLSHEQEALDRRMETLDASKIKNLSPKDFYQFLHQEYFVWKYTQKNRLAITRKNLEKYTIENRLQELADIQHLLFRTKHSDIAGCLTVATRIRGLGIAGASGLLAVLFPADFGVVDQFVVKSLLKIEFLSEHDLLSRMKPEMLALKDGVVLTCILRQKADALNKLFHTNFWTPRKIDMILWSIER